MQNAILNSGFYKIGGCYDKFKSNDKSSLSEIDSERRSLYLK